MKDIKVVNLNYDDEEDCEDEGFQAFIEEIKSGNESALFLISRKDGTLAIGSTYKNVKDLSWDIQRLIGFGQDLIRGLE